MAYKQPKGLGLTGAKTGAGIPSALTMKGSPVHKDFPVKPKMKLASYEGIINKITGNQLNAADQNEFLTSGTIGGQTVDQSSLEGITNLSKLNEQGSKSTAQISNRMMQGQSRDRDGYVTLEPRAELRGYTEGTTSTDANTGEQVVTPGQMGAYPSTQNMNRTRSAQDEIANSIQNFQAGSGGGFNIQDDGRVIESDLYGIGEDGYGFKKNTTADGEDIITTQRLTQKSDVLPNIDKPKTFRGAVRRGYGQNERSNLTQGNINIADGLATTLSDIQANIADGAEYFEDKEEYKEGGKSYNTFSDLYSRPAGNIVSGNNVQDNYTHMDRIGNQYGLILPDYQSPNGNRRAMHSKIIDKKLRDVGKENYGNYRLDDLPNFKR